MGYQLKQPYLVSQLANDLSLAWRGSDLEITHIRPLDGIDEGALCFAKTSVQRKFNFSCAIIGSSDIEIDHGALIETADPRLVFAQALILLDKKVGFLRPTQAPLLDEDVVVSSTAVLGRGVVIGARTIIGHNVVVADGVKIGEDCIIKSNTVIGESGFGFERDSAGVPIRLLHLGGVVIGNRVEIGSLNTVCRATLGNTIIEDDVKTDDHVHIAHNCHVRRGALLTACAELSGGVDIGEFAWVGPNTSIIQKAVLGSNAFVGIGSNITKSVPERAVVAGNPAKILKMKN